MELREGANKEADWVPLATRLPEPVSWTGEIHGGTTVDNHGNFDSLQIASEPNFEFFNTA